MKKLKLKLIGIEALTKVQMKMVLGGNDYQLGSCVGQPCNIYLNCCTYPLWCSNGHCTHGPGNH